MGFSVHFGRQQQQQQLGNYRLSNLIMRLIYFWSYITALGFIIYSHHVWASLILTE
jgi:hypothetical protein